MNKVCTTVTGFTNAQQIRFMKIAINNFGKNFIQDLLYKRIVGREGKTVAIKSPTMAGNNITTAPLNTVGIAVSLQASLSSAGTIYLVGMVVMNHTRKSKVLRARNKSF